ncbi:hypothetical protein ACLQ2Q_22085 [Microbacterium sp. DT81.1]|uniref:hypothetical protein n=1 Tax=Microbacterium sp. DT81.1 TaxID=3393413 RepID=UPI003CF85573
MLDRATAESVIYRVAVASLGYYPDKPSEEPGYTIEEDLDWCVMPLAHLDGPYLQGIRMSVLEVITDPTSHRREFTRDLLKLVND